MKQERFKEIFEKLEIPHNKWINLSEIAYILLNDGRGIIPNWQYLKFLIDDKENIFIKHGTSEPYGAKLSRLFSPSFDMRDISFPPGKTVIPTKFYSSFREPKSGDIIVAVSNEKIIDYSVIDSIMKMGNLTSISLMAPLKNCINRNDFLLSFYDPGEYVSDTFHMHSEEEVGIFMKFVENQGKEKKNIGCYEEIIKPKQIKEIELKVSISSNPLKTFKLT